MSAFPRGIGLTIFKALYITEKEIDLLDIKSKNIHPPKKRMTKQNWIHETKKSSKIIVGSELKSTGPFQPDYVSLLGELTVHIIGVFILKITERFIIEGLLAV